MKILSFVFLCISLGFILFGINKGFDWSDEGMYALLAIPEQENQAGIFNYDLFFKLLHQWTGIEFGLIGLRALRLFTCFMGAAALTGFWKNFNQETSLSFQVFQLSLVGILASYAFLPQTFSYNSITLLSSCLWIWGISFESYSKRHLLILGGSLALLFYAKITVCILLCALTIPILWSKSPSSSKLSGLVFLTVPFFIMESAFFLFLGESALFRLLNASDLMSKRSDYEFWMILKYTLVGFFWSVLVFIPFLISGFLFKRAFTVWTLFFGISIVVFVVISYFTSITSEWNHWVFFLPLAGIAFLIPQLKWTQIKAKQLLLVLLLLVFPFLLHFGSNVYFLRLGIHYWGFWVLGLFFLWKKSNKPSFPAIPLSAAVLTCILVVNGVFLHPFNTSNLLDENEVWEYRTGSFIYLSTEMHSFYQNLKIELDDVSDNRVTSIYMNPGLLYMTGKTYPKTPGIWSRDQYDFHFRDDESLRVLITNSLQKSTDLTNGYTLKKELILPPINKIEIFWKE